MTLVLSTLVCIVGIVIYATYHSCDPFILGHVRARDQVTTLSTYPCLFTLILSTLVYVVDIVIYETYNSCNSFILGHVQARDR